MEVEIPAHTLVKPHTHTREDEFSLILEGTVGVRVGDRELTAGPGSYLVKPRHTPHAMWNATSAPARVIEILAPGRAGSLFRGAGADLGRAPTRGGVLPARGRLRHLHPGRLDRRAGAHPR